MVGVAASIIEVGNVRIDVVDPKHGVLRVRIEHEDDLWLLSLLLSPGDRVRGVTTRDVSLGYEKRRVPMVLTVEVKKVEYQPFTARLRIHGVVLEGPDRFGVKGSHHTLNVGVGSEITVFKKRWNPQMLEEVLRFAKPYRVILVAVDFDEYAVAILQSQGVKIVDERRVTLPFREEAFENAKETLISRIAKNVVEVAEREGIDSVVVASPGSLKEEIAEKIREMNPKLRVYLDTVANGGYPGIQELLHRDVVRNIIRDNAVLEASKIVEKFDELLVKDPNRVAYGLKQIRIAASIGAIDTLLVTDELLLSSIENEVVREIIDEATKRNSRLVIVPVDTPVGQRIKYLGGAIAILRYSLDLESLERSIGESNSSRSDA